LKVFSILQNYIQITNYKLQKTILEYNNLNMEELNSKMSEITISKKKSIKIKVNRNKKKLIIKPSSYKLFDANVINVLPCDYPEEFKKFCEKII
jgi:hypothetical protein